MRFTQLEDADASDYFDINCRGGTAEAEYFSASTAATLVLYLRNLLDQMGCAQQAPTPVYHDKTVCLEWGINVIGGRERAKHINIRKHFAHEVLQTGHRKLRLLNHVSTTSQLAECTPLIYNNQAATFLACCWHLGQEGGTNLRDLCPQEEVLL
jgi:hypothetical protein